MLTREQLKHLAELAKIEFTEEELDKFLVDFNNILNYVEEIKELDLSKFEPMIGGPVQKLELRDDEVSNCPEETKTGIINQFPERQENYLKLPKIISKS
jgi:aspartyl-tRNA(Asn)/glutamyl-tRNA(Gln) amidotransferase subunit C